MSILEFLERAACEQPSHRAVIDEQGEYTYAQLRDLSCRAGCALKAQGAGRRRGVVVVAEKNVRTLAAMLGALYANSFYVPVDPLVSPSRLEGILAMLPDAVLVADEPGREFIQRVAPQRVVLLLEQITGEELREDLIERELARVVDDDPAYIMFTSGSTGTPKGVVVSRRAVRSFIETFVDAFGLQPSDVIANQAPFDFDVSVKDIYGALASEATLLLVPRRLFSAPAALVDYLAEHGATVMTWAVAALCLVTSLHALDERELPTVRRVLFSGEVMPLRHLREWMEHLPNALFANLYGPTEVTCNCTYHVIERGRDYGDGIPIGMAFPNREVLLVDDEEHDVTEPGSVGEIIVRGSSLAAGYVGADERSERRFCQNPLNSLFPDRVYRTGDLGRLTEDGQIVFCGRRDNQIKHQGHRIELEEIDALIEQCDGVRRCRCGYDERRKRIIAFIEGEATPEQVRSYALEVMAPAFAPSQVVVVETMPLTKNGKVDRAALLQMGRK